MILQAGGGRGHDPLPPSGSVHKMSFLFEVFVLEFKELKCMSNTLIRNANDSYKFLLELPFGLLIAFILTL